MNDMAQVAEKLNIDIQNVKQGWLRIVVLVQPIFPQVWVWWGEFSHDINAYGYCGRFRY
jgi:hypothetical protein